MSVHLPTITTFSVESIVNRAMNFNYLSSGYVSATYPSTNLAIYYPFAVFRPLVLTMLFVHNGSVASGNIDVGIYNEEGVRIVSSGSTAQSGTSVCQSFDVTDTTLQKGLYYFAVSMDNTTGTLFRIAPGIRQQRQAGVFQQSTAFPLPATATFAANAQSYIASMGLTTRSFV